MDAAQPDVKRHHGLVRLAHWLNAIVLLGMIASGLQIYAAFTHFGPRGAPYPNPFDGRSLPGWARLGGWLAGGLNWHFALAWPFVITGLVYLGFLAVTGEWRSLLFRPRDIGPAIQMQLYYLRPPEDSPAAGQAQRAAEERLHVHRRARRALGPDRLRHLQAGPARLAHPAVRRVRAGPLLALLGRVDLRRLHAAARRAGVPGRSGLAPRDDHRVVPGKVSEP